MIYKEMKQYLEYKKLFELDMLFDYIKYVCKNQNIYDFVDDLIIDDECENEYDPKTQILYINPNEILYETRDKSMPNLINLITKEERDSEIIKDYNRVNIYNLFAINHELNHILQNKIEDDPHDLSLKKALLIKDLILSCIDEDYYNGKYYKKYHDYFFHEYDANINAYMQTLLLLNSYNLDNIKDSIFDFNRIAASHILYLYRDINNKQKMSTPVTNLIKLYNHLVDITDDIIPYDDLTRFKKIEKPKTSLERLKIGFSIDRKTLIYLYRLSHKESKTLNLFNEISY